MIFKIIKWMYGDFIRGLTFLFIMAVIADVAIVFLAYPLQFVLSVVGLFITVAVFIYVFE